MTKAEHARQRIIQEQLQYIRDSLELIEEAMRSQWFKVCPQCGHADLATDVTAVGCMMCGARLVHEPLGFDPTTYRECDERCTRVRCLRHGGIAALRQHAQPPSQPDPSAISA